MTQAPDNLNQRPLVVGTGPCGLFAGLVLAQMGFNPIILERGKPVRERTVDTFGFWRQRELDPESNVQFGEGGAGTFSDGKLHTQIKDKNHLGRKVLTEFVEAGAPEEILYISKPHIGTLKLVKIVEKMRNTIQDLGGEFLFQSRVDDLIIEDGQLRGVVLGQWRKAPQRSCHPGDRPQRTRHLSNALSTGRADRSQTFFDGLTDRTSSTYDR